MIKLDRKRDVLAINLTYAEQRAWRSASPSPAAPT
jgi:hypothetical protein